MRFFHSFATARRNTNTIWSLNDLEGNSVSEDPALKQLGKQHFSDLFGDNKSTNIADQLRVISLFPNMTTDEDIDCFLKPIFALEVEAILKGFKKDKSPGPDGCPVEFFLAFFDLVGGGTSLGYGARKNTWKYFWCTKLYFLDPDT